MMSAATEEQSIPADVLLDMLERVYFRYRHILAPPLAAGLVWCSSALAWAATGWSFTVPIVGMPVVLAWWPFGLYALAVVAWLLLVATDIVHHTERVPLWGEDKPGERAGESAIANTQVVTAFAWGYAAVLTLVQAWDGPSRWTLLALVVFLLPSWVYWSQARTVRRGVEVFRAIEKWDGDAVGGPGLEAHAAGARAAADGSWWEWPLRSTPKGRWTAAAVRKLLPRIAARYEVNAAELEVDEPTPGRMVLRYTKTDPDERALTFTPPPDGFSIRKRIPIGRWDDDGTVMTDQVYRDEHGGVDSLTIGQKGSGKSNAGEAKAAYVAAAKDAVLWIVDLKPGAQQWRAWAPVADWFATTPDEADRMFAALMTIAHVRGGGGGRVVKPSTKRPAIHVLLDEGALYFAEAIPGGGPERMAAMQRRQARISLVENLLAVSRSFAIAVGVYLQRAVWDNVGGATIRGHLIGGSAALFRTAKNEDARLALDMPEEEADRFRTSEIPRSRPGTVVLSNADSEAPRKGRVVMVTEADRDDVIRRFRDKQPTLEAAAAAALGDVYVNRQRGLPGGQVAVAADDADGDPEAVDLPPAAQVPPRLSEEESLLMVWQSLERVQGSRGATVKKTAGEAKRSEPTVRARLNQLVDMGVARAEGHPKRYLTLGQQRDLQDLLERDGGGDDA